MAAIVSAQSGYWDVGTTWVGGVPPGPGDSAQVQPGHTVSVRTDVTIAFGQIMPLRIQPGGIVRILDGATLSVSSATSIYVYGAIRIADGGTLKWGTGPQSHSEFAGETVLEGPLARVRYGNTGFAYIAQGGADGGRLRIRL